MSETWLSAGQGPGQGPPPQQGPSQEMFTVIIYTELLPVSTRNEELLKKRFLVPLDIPSELISSHTALSLYVIQTRAAGPKPDE